MCSPPGTLSPAAAGSSSPLPARAGAAACRELLSAKTLTSGFLRLRGFACFHLTLLCMDSMARQDHCSLRARFALKQYCLHAEIQTTIPGDTWGCPLRRTCQPRASTPGLTPAVQGQDIRTCRERGCTSTKCCMRSSEGEVGGEGKEHGVDAWLSRTALLPVVPSFSCLASSAFF